MILGMSLEAFTALHVAISLIAIATGLVVMFGLLGGKRLDNWTAWFLATTALTSITGFLFPNEKLTPGIKVGIISLVILAVAIAARYVFHLTGVWRSVYTVGATLVLYFNFLVLVVQTFEKAPALHALAPTGSEPPILFTQLAVLALFIALGTFATTRFRRAGSAKAAAHAA